MTRFKPADEMAERMYESDPVLIALTSTQRRKLIKSMEAAGVSSPQEFDKVLEEAGVVEMLRISRYLAQKNPGMDGSKRTAIAETLAAQKLQSDLALGFALAEVLEAEREAKAKRNEGEAEVLAQELEAHNWDYTIDDDDEQ